MAVASILATNDTRPGIPIQEPGLTVTGFAVAATTPQGRSILHTGMDLFAAMLQFSGPDDMICRFVNNRKPRRLTTRVNLNPMGMNGRVLYGSLLQNDRERVAAKDDRFAFPEQFPRPGRLAGIEGLPIGIQNKHSHDSISLRLHLSLRW